MEGWSIDGWTGYTQTGTVNKLVFLYFLGSGILNNSFTLNDPELCWRLASIPDYFHQQLSCFFDPLTLTSSSDTGVILSLLSEPFGLDGFPVILLLSSGINLYSPEP